METSNQYQEEEKEQFKPVKKDQEGSSGQDAGEEAAEKQDTEFENPSVDPGFESSSSDEEEEDAQQNDALNYKNDRENGAYNPKNI